MASLTYGPYTPTAGTAIVLKVDTQTVGIQVKNLTRLDLLVYFGTPAPTITTTLNGEWHAVIPHGHTEFVPIQTRAASTRERTLNAVQAFNGTVTLMPVNNSGNLALSGAASSTGQAWVTAYGPYDNPPQSASMPQTVDLSSQPRVVTVPLGIVPIVGTFSATSGGKSVIFPTFNLSAANLANQVANVYLYGGYITMQHVTSTIALNVEFVILNAGLTVLSTAVIWSGELWANNTNNTHDSTYLVNGPVVYVANISLAGLIAPTQVGLQLHCNGLSGTSPAPVTFTIAWALDTTNQGFPWAVGSQVGFFNNGTGNGPY